MNEKDAPFDLCFEVLNRLEKAGVLKDLVLVGSWCIYFYRNYFEAETLSSLRTRDIDFLIPTPPKFKVHVEIPDLLADLGFLVERNREGYMRLQHPELIIDFLVPEKGRGSHGPYPLKNLGINAQPLRFMNLLLENTVKVVSHGNNLTLPHPINYAFQKLLIDDKRKDQAKRMKDRQQAMELLELLLKGPERSRLKSVFYAMPKGWKKTVLKVLRDLKAKEILNLIS